MKKIIRKILKEDRRQMFLDKIVHVMKNDYPLFKNMKDYGFYGQLSRDELNYVFSSIFGKSVKKYSMGIQDENGIVLYKEFSDGYWDKWEYNENNNLIYYENNYGEWVKIEYDENGEIIYKEDSNGNIRDNR